MQWEPVSLLPDNSKLRAQVITEHDTLRAVHSFTLETPWSHLLSVMAERATPETDKLFHACAFAPALQRGLNATRLKAVQASFDLSPYLREYDPDEPHPAWFLSGYLSRETTAKIARKMRLDIERSAREPGWLPGGRAGIVQARIKAVQRREAGAA